VEWELNGCVRSDTINITPSVLEAFNIGNDTTICQGDTLTFMVPPLHPSVSYNWQNGSTDESLMITGPTNVHLTASIDHCTMSDTVQVTSTFPSFSLGADQLICPGETVVLDASLPNTTYQWQDGSTEPTYTAGSTGLYSVELSRGECHISETVAVEVFSTLTTNLGPDTTVCPGVFPLLSVYVPGASYVWSDQTLVNSTFAYEPGLYSVTVTIDGCEVVDSILVSEYSPALDWPNELYLCDGEMLTLDASEVEGSYIWQDGSTASSYLVSVPGQYSVEIDGENCQELFFVEVLTSTLSEFDLGNDTTLCSSEIFVINTGSPLENYAWSDGSNQVTLTVTQGGLYWLETTQGNCYFRDSILLEYVPLPDIEIGNDTTLCPGEVLSLQADFEPPISIQWSTGATTPSIVVETPGDYGVEIELDGCIRGDGFNLDYYEATSLELGEDITICKTQPLVLAPEITGPPATFLWQDGTSTPSYDVQNSGTYSLILTNICETVTDEINITVEECTCEVYLPNAFSPNDDGNNDTFRPYTTCPITDYEIRIFDRWGGLRFTSNSIENGWQGLEVNTGVYLYTLRYRDRDGQWQQRVGEVSLIR
ncbi:MAG: gliding motility-associated C-terminal domain-containing protein, partial [Lewinella sp.]|uniref:T9SS type B sorting domain-containing protein n=1 Tax=Lewinella sp. TaxID=2004506 RepID=UPI003D6B1EAE